MAAGEADGGDFFASLRARQVELEDAKEQLDSRWRKAECDSAIRCVLDNWVRRLDVDWPYAALGTAQGGVYVADLASGKTLAKADGAHPPHLDGTSSEMRMLYGDNDGGGLTAIALRDGLVVSAGRDGGARLWRVLMPADGDGDGDGDGGGDDGGGGGGRHQIEPVGALASDGVVSSVLICGDDVWTASLDGTLRRWEVAAGGGGGGAGGGAGAAAATIAAACVRTIRAPNASPLLCIAACEARGLVASGDAAGTVRLYTVRRLWTPLAQPIPSPSQHRRHAPCSVMWPCHAAGQGRAARLVEPTRLRRLQGLQGLGGAQHRLRPRRRERRVLRGGGRRRRQPPAPLAGR